MRFVLSYWSDPTWRLLRIVELCVVALVLITLVVVLSGVSSWDYPLAAAVILNLVVSIPLVGRTIQLSRRKRQR